MEINGKKFVYRLKEKDFHCALELTMEFIGGKWKAIVLWYLRKDKKRFSELRRHIPEITEKMLSTQLKVLTKDGFVSRKIYAEVPPRVEYMLTEKGKTLIPMLEEMAKWGRMKGDTEGELVEI